MLPSVSASPPMSQLAALLKEQPHRSMRLPWKYFLVGELPLATKNVKQRDESLPASRNALDSEVLRRRVVVDLPLLTMPTELEPSNVQCSIVISAAPAALRSMAWLRAPVRPRSIAASRPSLLIVQWASASLPVHSPLVLTWW